MKFSTLSILQQLQIGRFDTLCSKLTGSDHRTMRSNTPPKGVNNSRRYRESNCIRSWIAKKTVGHAHNVTGQNNDLGRRRVLQQSCWDHGSQLFTADELRIKHGAVVVQIAVRRPERDALPEELVIEFRSRNCHYHTRAACWHTPRREQGD